MLQNFFNSAFALRLGLWFGRIIPAWLGYALADIATWFVARGRSTLGRTVRDNLRVVLGETASAQAIETTARAVFRNAGRSYFDLYRGLAKGRDSVLDAVVFTDRAEQYLTELNQLGGSALVISGHISNFDLAGLAFSARNVPVQALTFRSPSSGYDLQNQIRQSWGLTVTPVDMAALRQALRRLREGGLVVTGADRPDPNGSGEFLQFFGRPAFLPNGHIRLAMQAGVPVGVAMIRNHPQRPHVYEVDVAPPIHLEMVGDRAQTIRHYAQQTLSIIEAAIRAHPDQWLMFYPVWADGTSVDEAFVGEASGRNGRAQESSMAPDSVVVPTVFSSNSLCPAPN